MRWSLTNEAIVIYGLRDTALDIRAHIIDNIRVCADFSYYRDIGYDINDRNPQVSVEIFDEAVIVDMIYPVEINLEDDYAELSKFNYYFPRTTTILPITGLVEEEVRVTLPEGDTIIITDGEMEITRKNHHKLTKGILQVRSLKDGRKKTL